MGVADRSHDSVLTRREGDVFYEHSTVDGVSNGVFSSDVARNGHVAHPTRGKRPSENGGLARGGSFSSTSSSEHDLPPLETRYPGRSRHPKRYICASNVLISIYNGPLCKAMNDVYVHIYMYWSAYTVIRKVRVQN